MYDPKYKDMYHIQNCGVEIEREYTLNNMKMFRDAMNELGKINFFGIEDYGIS